MNGRLLIHFQNNFVYLELYIFLVLQEVKKGVIQAGESESWEGVEVKVPAVPPTGLGGNCSIISVTYK